jgi:hypothetical protein
LSNSALLCHQSGIKRVPENDTWYCENPHSGDIYSRSHLKTITKAHYNNFCELLVEAPRQSGRKVKLVLWHETQIAYVRQDLGDMLPPNILEIPVTEEMKEWLEREIEALEAKQRRQPMIDMADLALR